jgi:FAS-associated factor 2
MALIALQDNNNGGPKMTVIERIEGPSHAAELISQIGHAMERHGAVMNRLKHERSQREMERQLRVDQDAAYRESLKADQEKARKLELEKQEQKQREEQQLVLLQQKELQQQKREQYIRYLLTQVKKEELVEGPVAKLSFRLADGERVVRTFSKDATLEVSYICWRVGSNLGYLC